tara:strand:+ start:225 stop:401 length:177 start_codon:yes stop_codon:yes gene_type:complete
MNLISHREINALKKEAKKLKKQTGVGYQTQLNHLSKEKGFKDFEHLISTFKKTLKRKI